jgi:uncharacterized membrane protein
MTGQGNLEMLVPRPIRELPADLLAVTGVVLATDVVVFAPVVSETPLRVVFGLTLVLFCPGYALVAALFPERGKRAVGAGGDDGGDGASDADPGSEPAADAESVPESARTPTTGATGGGIDGIERVALSIGLSVAVVPLVGLVLNFTPLGIRLVPIMVAISVLTLGATALAARRRWALPAEERLTVPYREWFSNARSELFRPATRADAALNLLLAVSLVLAATSVGYALLIPADGEEFTEFYLLTENRSDELVAADYPTNLTRGEPTPLVLGIENNEGEPERYTVVVELQRVERGPNNTTTVLDERELRRFGPRVGANETWTRRHDLTPTMTGDRLRVVYLLYRDSPPSDPGTGTAYRELHLWVNVSRPS